MLARDDSVGAVRLANAWELAEIRATKRALAAAAADLSRIRHQLLQTNQDIDTQLSEIRTAARDLLGDAVGSSPERLIELIEDRISARTDALAAWEEIELAHKKAGRAADEGDGYVWS